MKFNSMFFRYLKDELSEEEKVELERALESREGLRKEFLDFKIEQYLHNNLPKEIIKEFEREIKRDPFTQKQYFIIQSNRFLKEELTKRQEEEWFKLLYSNKEYREEFDYLRIDYYINGQLKGRHLENFEKELKTNQKFYEKFRFSADVDNYLYKKGEENDPDDNEEEANEMDPFPDDITEEEFLEAVNNALKEVEDKKETRTPKQKRRDKVMTLKDLEELEKNADIDFSDPAEVDMHFNILKGIEKEKKKVKHDILMYDLEVENYYKPGQLFKEGKMLNESPIQNDSFADLDAFPKTYWFTRNKQVKVIHIKRKVINAIGIAVSSIIAVFLLLYIGIFSKQDANDKLFAQYYDTYQALIYKTNNGEEANFNKAMQFYKTKNYEKALKAFLFLSEDNAFYNDAIFYTGIIYIENTDYSKAIAIFNDIINNSKSKYTTDAEWYKALCLIKIGKTLQAKEVLQEMLQKDTYYKPKIKNIMKEL